jgi:hypothetical protein
LKATGPGEAPQTRWHIKRCSGLGNQEIGTLFGSMRCSAVSKSSARLETEMTQDKGLRDLVKEILSDIKARHPSAIFPGDIHTRSMTSTVALKNSIQI